VVVKLGKGLGKGKKAGDKKVKLSSAKVLAGNTQQNRERKNDFKKLKKRRNKAGM